MITPASVWYSLRSSVEDGTASKAESALLAALSMKPVVMADGAWVKVEDLRDAIVRAWDGVE